MTETTPRAPAPSLAEPSTLSVVVAAFTGLGYALSARSLLLLAVVFNFVLGLKAMDAQTLSSLEVLGVFCAFTIPPLAYLEIRRRS